MTQPYLISLLLAAAFVFESLTASGEEEKEIDFNRDIRPILSENCFHCHGPDAETREANLRLDQEEASREAFSSGTIWERVSHEDPAEQMPPPKSNRTLTEQQRDLLKRWIDAGAQYEEHWAYLPPVRPVVPENTNAIDTFVEKAHQEKDLGFSPRAESWRLLRRVSLDLIGLPPTPAELNAFLADDSPAAYEKAVDRLLASPRFGEKWARSWMDLARYADSNGYQADQLRDSWAYRDWVIDAFNKNMPFDRFSIEQLAGDLLPNATLAQKIATGFHRTSTCNVEAGVHPEENRTNQVVDRVNTTGTVWLGTTLECAQCHDHKYDPFSMQDYYGIFAYFNNTPLEVRNPSGKGVSFDFYGPKMDLPISEEKKAEHKRLTEELASLKEEKKSLIKQLDRRYDEWLKNQSRIHTEKRGKRAPKWTPLTITEFSGTEGEQLKSLDDDSHLVTGPIPDTTTYRITLKGFQGPLRALRLEMLAHPSLPAKGPARGNGSRPNAILSEILVSDQAGKKVSLVDAVAGYSQSNWDVSQAIDGDLKKGWAIGPQFGVDHWAAFEVEKVTLRKEDLLTIELVQNYGGGRSIGRLRLSGSDQFPETQSLSNAIQELLTKTDRTKEEDKELRTHFDKEQPSLKAIDLQILKTSKSLEKASPDTTLVMVEMEEPRETHIMMRGNYLAKGDQVSPQTPAVLHQSAEKLPANRLGFAKWLMQPENPLVARVAVNRWWAEIFGLGLVRTLEDFGTQSEPPTHPELLDWLAVEFVDSGWDMKHIIKQMVMSRSYQQSSSMALEEEWVQVDPENRYLSRGPRFRMSAEMIRDNALSVSGLLSTKMGGEPIMPYQPPGLWRQVGRNEPKWIDAKNEDRFRRGVYVVWRRAAPYPSFVNFDAPDRGSCVVSRPRTNTPLQALTLLNDPAYTEMALALANQVMVHQKDQTVPDQIAYLFQRVLCRAPSQAEVDHLAYLIETKEEIYAADQKAAKELISGGSSVVKISDKLPRETLAAWFYVCNVLLNLDETVTKG